MGYKGIIFEGTGLGHIGNTMYESVKKANEKIWIKLKETEIIILNFNK